MSGALMLRKIRSRGVDIHLPSEQSVTSFGRNIEGLLKSLAQDAIPWDISNVLAYLDALGDNKRLDLTVRDLPCVLPPIPLLWLEAPMPRANDWTLLRSYAPYAHRFGVFLRTIDMEWDGARDYVEEQFVPAGVPLSAIDRARFAVDATLFFDLIKPTEGFPTTVQGPHIQVVTVLDDQGAWSCHDDGRAFAAFIPVSDSLVRWYDDAITGSPAEKKPAVQQALALMSRDFMLPVWFAISLTHCSNVKVVENSGRYLNRQERRFAERRGEPPALKYYTLEIGAITKTLNTEGNAKRDGLQKAMHICRGHFATYSEDKPLFGKYAGRFWIPAHVRGSTEAGTVVKDYRVKAPASATN